LFLPMQLQYIFAVWSVFITFTAYSIPNYHGCTTDVAKTLPYCNTALSFEERVSSLINSLTLDEKISLISPDDRYDTCPIVVSDIPRIGLPRYMWLTETNTDVSSACVSKDRCATTFIGPTGLGATFNRTVWRAKGDVISTELRAFSNINWYRGIGSNPWGFYLIGIDGFGPNINIVRDPRFGRNSELPGEDPFLTGSYAVEYVKGQQQRDANGYFKMRAYLKHFTAYSVETNRGHDTHDITPFDFWDTYLPAYEMAFVQANASGVMCSYNGENGVPNCANAWLLNEVMRKRWNQPDALVTTDCGAIPNLRGAPARAATPEIAAAWAINNGSDIEGGSSIWRHSLHSAINQGLSSEATVNQALRRSLIQLFQAGRFDPVEKVSWTSITVNSINSTLHQQVSYEAALQSFVLLKNDGVLPLMKGKRIAVLGPQAVARYGLLSDYYGDIVCYSENERPNNKSWDCIKTIAEGIAEVNVGGVTVAQMGVDINSQRMDGIQPALNAAAAADVVVLVLGIDKSIEYEGVDRKTTTLPGLQESFAMKVFAVGKPTVLILVNGGILSIDNLINSSKAIVEAFNPSVPGGKALAESLFGIQNRWGKLPVTIYPANYISEVDLFNFDMSKPPGRTYRYYTGKPLWPFGYGLSLTTFGLTCTAVQSPNQFSCNVMNTGSMKGDEVVMVFHSVGSDIRSKVDHPVPIKQLVGFERVSVDIGKSVQINFTFDKTAYQLTNKSGDKIVYPGHHLITFSRGYGQDVQFDVVLSQN